MTETREPSATADAALHVTSNVKAALQGHDPGVYLIDGDEYVRAAIRPTLDVERLAEAMGATLIYFDPKVTLVDAAGRIAAEYVLLASEDRP